MSHAQGLTEEVFKMQNGITQAKGASVGKRIAVILGLALTGWTVCGMIMGAGLATTTEFNAILIHAALVPVVFLGVSALYFKVFAYTTPLQTAAIFVTFVVLMDVFVVSILILGNFDMFKSFLGTWFVFGEIFATTLLTGRYVTARAPSGRPGPSTAAHSS